MNLTLRLTTLLLAMAIAPFVLCAPALAQTTSGSVQYVGESPGTFADNAGQGSDAVNDAMAGTASSSASPPASGEGPVAPEGGTPSDDEGMGTQASSGGSAEADAGEGVGSITELPDTGGAPLAALGFGALLAAFGLAARGLVGREA